MAATSTTVDRENFPTLFRVNHIRDNLNPLRIKMMKFFNWTRVGTIFEQDEIEVSVRITITRLCIILQYFTAVKTIIFRLKIVIFFILLLKI